MIFHDVILNDRSVQIKRQGHIKKKMFEKVTNFSKENCKIKTRRGGKTNINFFANQLNLQICAESNVRLSMEVKRFYKQENCFRAAGKSQVNVDI